MTEQRLSFQTEILMSERFDSDKEYWTNAVKDGRAQKTEFFMQVFESPETEIYREVADDEMIMTIARTLNDTWIGYVQSHGKIDTNNR